ncbi:unannotated protein [freshwater metagenome]|uniref:Unannotated protein n=1 Tax=freshwater metagenome TaxID=449393 RepID=A0A6J7J4G0_9ZZZZ
MSQDDFVVPGAPPELGPLMHSGGELMTRAERRQLGRDRRKVAQRSSHAGWVAPPTRRDPFAILDDQNRRRFPDLIPLRWGRMAASPFTFYRGAAAVMAADLAGTPITGLDVQACGDAHLQNFGLFASPERNLLFDVNDFDETLPGPWEWDVKRLAASVELAARDNGFTAEQAEAATLQSVASYRGWMAVLADQTQLDVWYAKVDVSEIIPLLPTEEQKRSNKLVERARRHTTLQALDKLTAVVDGRRVIVDNPPIVEHLPELTTYHAVHTVLDRYKASLQEDKKLLLERFEIIDIARKVVGVGSVGTHCWIALCSADREDDDPLFLQIKEANRSVLEPWIGASSYSTNGERVVVGQRLMQAASDMFLGWTKFRERHYYIRQLRDMKGSADVATMTPTLLSSYAGVCGMTLARAHARTGDPIAISAYLGEGDVFDRAIASFSKDYADQTERDHAELRAAIDSGKIQALEGC